MRKCVVYASRFPTTFDPCVRDGNVTNMTDVHTVRTNSWIDQSLVEYRSMEECNTMHFLAYILQNFVAYSVTEQPSKRKYFHLFCSHFILLSKCIIILLKPELVTFDHLYTMHIAIAAAISYHFCITAGLIWLNY